MRRFSVHSVVLAIMLIVLAQPDRASAIGWDSDDFLIGGGSSFSDRIGVFDHDLSFKGYLDPNFVTVAGMDFDAQGRLVAVASGNVRSVRVYEPVNGAIVAGFTSQDDLLGTPGDLKVAPDGSYVIATQNFGGGNGARQFATDGTFLRQLGSGWIRGVAVLPGNRAWTAGVGSNDVNVFDLGTGLQVGTLTVSGLSGANSMTYSRETNTVLFASIQASALLETDLSGLVVRTFVSPRPAGFEAVTRGPLGDVYASVMGSGSLMRWSADGSFIAEVAAPSSLGFVAHLVWAGNAPEPNGSVALLIMAGLPLSHRRIRHR